MESKTIPTNLSQTKHLPNRPFKAVLFSVAEFNRRYTEDERFREFAKQVYHYLDRMKPNKLLRLDRYEGETLDWIVLTAVAFINEGVHYLSYEFTDDYRFIRHTQEDAWEVKIATEYKYGKLNIT